MDINPTFKAVQKPYYGIRHLSSTMAPVPTLTPRLAVVQSKLEQREPRFNVQLIAREGDRSRLEHTQWLYAGDCDVVEHRFVAAEGVVFLLYRVE